MDFRHEVKHELNSFERLELIPKLKTVMKSDPNTIDGRYLIRSLYFDNMYDKALLEKINGVNFREKFRIRYYNFDTSYIVLEKKSKINGLCSKEQIKLSYDEANEIEKGNFDIIKDREESLLKEFYSKICFQGLRPKTIVDYERIPFIYDMGNVRVTLDFNIKTGLYSKDFLNPNVPMVSVNPNLTILEVKWDEYLPSVIKDIIQTPEVRSSAFSKYAACRIYG